MKSTDYQEKSLVCFCGERFVWTSGEQSFMNTLLQEGRIPAVKTPRNCPKCRERRREERQVKESQNFNSDYPE